MQFNHQKPTGLWVSFCVKCVYSFLTYMHNHNVSRERVLFFNVALRDGHFMSRPVFNPLQSLIGEVIHSIERFNPRFAWIQFLFSQRDCNHLLMYAKSELENFVQFANAPQYDERSRQRIPRKEMGSQWYKLAQIRIKKLEQVLPNPIVIVAINGMWVANENNPASAVHQIQELPFSLCSDETDRLRAFTYRDPRILKMLVERRMVTDVSQSIYRYGRSREEPPSLVLTPDELPYFVHMPTGASAKGLVSIRPAAHFPVGGTLKARDVMPREDNRESSKESVDDSSSEQLVVVSKVNEQLGQPTRDMDSEGHVGKFRKKGPKIVALKKVPTLEEPLEEDDALRLSQIVSRNVRTFELIYDSKGGLAEGFKQDAVTRVLLSSSCETSEDDLEGIYIPEIESVYGKLDYELVSDPRPGFVMRELRDIVVGR